MPELPEVETILRGLKPRVLELSIRDVLIGDRKILQIRADRLRRAIRSQTIRGISRRGKYLVFELDCHYLIFHFGMTGQLTYRDPEQADSKGFLRHPVTGLQSGASASSGSAYSPAYPPRRGKGTPLSGYSKIRAGFPGDKESGECSCCFFQGSRPGAFHLRIQYPGFSGRLPQPKIEAKVVAVGSGICGGYREYLRRRGAVRGLPPSGPNRTVTEEKRKNQTLRGHSQSFGTGNHLTRNHLSQLRQQ